MVIAGLANSVCNDCANLDGTYSVPYKGGVGTPACEWWNNAISAVCEDPGDFQNLDVLITSSWIKVILGCSFACGYSGIEWSKTLATPLDCENVSNLDIPFLSSDHMCDGSSATCRLTAL